jgi:hypothetical protein
MDTWVGLMVLAVIFAVFLFVVFKKLGMGAQKIVLISCTKSQHKGIHPARELYTKSHWFRAALAYAARIKPDRIFILSTKYHLLRMDDQVSNYDVSIPLNGWKVWTNKVLSELNNREGLNLKQDKFVILASKKYYSYLTGTRGVRIRNFWPLKSDSAGRHGWFEKHATDTAAIWATF